MLDATLLDGVVTLKTGWPNERNIGCNNNVGSNVASNVAFVWPPLYLTFNTTFDATMLFSMLRSFGQDVGCDYNTIQHVATSVEQNEHVHFVCCVLQQCCIRLATHTTCCNVMQHCCFRLTIVLTTHLQYCC